MTATTSGNNHLVLGDNSGQIHLIPRNWQVVTFRAYEICVSLAIQLANSPLLITIGVSIIKSEDILCAFTSFIRMMNRELIH